MSLSIEPLYYADRLTVINPSGDVGVCTLWSKVESAQKILEESSVDLAPSSSRIAIIANLYGNGLPQMLRNLLHNPQIRHIVILGKNLSGSREWLLNFFEHGLEEVEFLGAKANRIRNTTRTITRPRTSRGIRKMNRGFFWITQNRISRRNCAPSLQE